jgi:hypothetical protein
MITVPTQAESLDPLLDPDSPAHPADCLAAQRQLVRAARELSQKLPLVALDLTDQLRLGFSCIHFAAERALATHNDQEQVLAWKECALGERQIRRATFQSLKAGHIDNADYDRLFTIGNHAKRVRDRELARLRTRLRQLAVV